MVYASLAVLGVCTLMFPLTANFILGWNLDATCPGTETFCNGVYWRYLVDYLPTWLFIAHVMVVLALSMPVALVRVSPR